MAVQRHDFEGCCTADILTNFGQSRTSEYGNHAVTYPKLRAEVIARIGQSSRHGIITAILTSEQTTAAKALKDLGFIGTGMAKKYAHNEVDIELYYLHCKDWEEPALPEEEVVPVGPLRDEQGRFITKPAPVANPFGQIAHGIPIGHQVVLDAIANDPHPANEIPMPNGNGFIITYGRYNKEMCILHRRLRSCEMTGIIRTVFANDQVLFDLTGKTFEEHQERRRHAGWSQINRHYI